jgi:hypothetical protein
MTTAEDPTPSDLRNFTSRVQVCLAVFGFLTIFAEERPGEENDSDLIGAIDMLCGTRNSARPDLGRCEPALRVPGRGTVKAADMIPPPDPRWQERSLRAHSWKLVARLGQWTAHALLLECVDFVLRVAAGDALDDRDDRFALDRGRLRANLDQCRRVLASLPSFNLKLLRSSIDDELTQAIGRVESDGRATTAGAGPRARAAGQGEADGAGPDPHDLVTLNQAAAMVHRHKRTLEGYKAKGMPGPVIKGGGGKPALYSWSILRPWLMRQFDIKLPEKFPPSRRHA